MGKIKVTLKLLRIDAGLTQDEVAKKIGVSTSTWSLWEHSKRFPNVPEIKKIEKLFNVSYADINFLT